MIFNLRSSAIPLTAKVIGFRGTERISTPYCFDVFFTVPVDFFTDDLHDAVNSKAELSVALGEGPLPQPFRFHGLLSSIRLVRAADSALLFQAQLVPQLWQLSLTRHSRVFTKKTVIDVLEEILGESGIDYELRLEATYELEEQITQYKESNLAFIQRWMDREGLYYFFDQGEDGELLVITDNKAAHGSMRVTPIRYFPQSGWDVTTKQAFDNFAATHSALPASVRLVDYDYAKPLLDVASTVSVSENAVGEITEYGGRFFSPQDAKRLAKIRAEDLLATRTVFEATGAATHLAAGHTFVLEDHPIPSFNDEYLVTSIEHHGYETSLGPAWGSLVGHKYDDLYRVELKCLSKHVQFRNGQQTPWPRVDGYENAVVDAPAASSYAQIDDMGRYLLKFKFDEGSNKEGKASTYVRMAQPHGGTQEGFHFPLRKGVEVICSFLGGDPDRPVIVGVVHNAVHPTVVTQANHTENVIRSGSLNHLVMEDTAGAMYLEAYCPIFASTLFLGFGEWNFDLTTQGRGRIQTTLNLNIDVDQHFDVDVVSYVTWQFHDTHTWINTAAVDWIFNDIFTWKVSQAVDIDWNATVDLYAKGASTIKFDATLGLTVAGKTTAVYNADVDVDINASLDTLVTGSEKHKVDGDREREVGGNEKVTIGGNQEIHVKGQQKITVDQPEEKHWLSNTRTTTIGISESLFVGVKNTTNIALTNDMFVGMKNSFQLSAVNDLTISRKTAFTMGAHFDYFGGVKMSISNALSMSLAALNVGFTGMSVSATGVSISAKTTTVETGGPDVDVKVLKLFL
jgi:type VI secretion system secreted protein VgrG